MRRIPDIDIRIQCYHMTAMVALWRKAVAGFQQAAMVIFHVMAAMAAKFSKFWPLRHGPSSAIDNTASDTAWALRHGLQNFFFHDTTQHLSYHVFIRQ